MEEIRNEKDLLELGDRMIRLRYSMDSNHLSTIFRDISVSDYLILSTLTRRMGIHEAKVYLSDISREMEQPMTRVSQIVQNLQNKGFVYWNHDSQGTFIYLSETGRNAMKQQQTRLREFMGDVIEAMGQDAFVALLDQMQELETVMETEAAKLTEDHAEE